MGNFSAPLFRKMFCQLNYTVNSYINYIIEPTPEKNTQSPGNTPWHYSDLIHHSLRLYFGK